MKKARIVCAAIVLFIGMVYLGFQTGLDIKKDHLEKQVVVERNHHLLTDLRGCMYAMDSDVWRFVLNPVRGDLTRVLRRATACKEFIALLGKNISDEDASAVVGEAAIFYDGYIDALREILVRQVELTILYVELDADATDIDSEQRIVELTQLQVEGIIETRNFLDHLEQLIVRVW